MNDLDRTRKRQFESSHPWLTFEFKAHEVPAPVWIMLGECHSKCDHLAGVPLQPDVAKHLYKVYLAKGVAATAAIEGNTLSESQVMEHIEGELPVPPSQEYLKLEIDNIVKGCNLILDEVKNGFLPPLSVDRIKELNKIVLNRLTLADKETIPGEIRKHSVGVGTYRGAPAEDCEFLLNRLCEWLNRFESPPGSEVVVSILKAVLAHLFLAWIHPFGDGNGRTARLIEVQVLLASGVPAPAAQLLSNHYNATRAEYYRHLDKARHDALHFVRYAVEGFRDGLREQISTVRHYQWNITWVNHVHTFFQEKGTLNDRRKHLLLDLSDAGPLHVSKVRNVSARVALAYKDRNQRTFLRDIKFLISEGLIRVLEGDRLTANREAILAFLPVRANHALPRGTEQ